MSESEHHNKQQMKVFKSFVNAHLAEFDKKIENFTDLSTGIDLFFLIKALVEKHGGKFSAFNKLDLKRSEMPVVQKSNVFTIIEYLQNEKFRVPLLSISAENIVKKDNKIILALLWNIILRYHIYNVVQDGEKKEDEEEETKEKEPVKVDVWGDMVEWINQNFGKEEEEPLKNDLEDWRNRGLEFFHRIVEKINKKMNEDEAKEIFEFNKEEDKVEIAGKCLEFANAELGVPMILDPEMVVIDLDKLSLATYFSFFRNLWKKKKQSEEEKEKFEGIIEELKGNIEKLETKLKESEEIHGKEKIELEEEMKKQHIEYEEKIKTLEKDITTYVEEKEERKVEFMKITKDLEDLKEESLKGKNKLMEDLKTIQNELHEKEKELVEEKNVVVKEKEELEKEGVELKEKNQVLEKNVTDLKAEMEEEKIKLKEAHEAEINKIKDEYLEKLQELVNSEKQTEKEKNEEVGLQKKLNDSLLVEMKEKDETINKLKSKKRRKGKNLKKKEAKIAELNKENEELKAQLDKMQIEIDKKNRTVKCLVEYGKMFQGKGWLKLEQGKIKKKFKYFWFEFNKEENSFAYFKDPDDSKSQLKVKMAEPPKVESHAHPKQDHCFLLSFVDDKGKTNEYVLSAETEDHQRKWVDFFVNRPIIKSAVRELKNREKYGVKKRVELDPNKKLNFNSLSAMNSLPDYIMNNNKKPTEEAIKKEKEEFDKLAGNGSNSSFDESSELMKHPK